jgi:hypothetical protein
VWPGLAKLFYPSNLRLAMPTDRPAYAAFIWHDGTSLYLQLPDSGYITRAPFTEAALSKALRLIAPCKMPREVDHFRPRNKRLASGHDIVKQMRVK